MNIGNLSLLIRQMDVQKNPYSEGKITLTKDY